MIYEELEIEKKIDIEKNIEKVNNLILNFNMTRVKNKFKLNKPLNEEYIKKTNSLYHKLNKNSIDYARLYCASKTILISLNDKEIDDLFKELKTLDILFSLLEDYNLKMSDQDQIVFFTKLKITPYIGIINKIVFMTQQITGVFGGAEEDDLGLASLFN